MVLVAAANKGINWLSVRSNKESEGPGGSIEGGGGAGWQGESVDCLPPAYRHDTLLVTQSAADHLHAPPASPHSRPACNQEWQTRSCII